MSVYNLENWKVVYFWKFEIVQCGMFDIVFVE